MSYVESVTVSERRVTDSGSVVLGVGESLFGLVIEGLTCRISILAPPDGEDLGSPQVSYDEVDEKHFGIILSTKPIGSCWTVSMPHFVISDSGELLNLDVFVQDVVGEAGVSRFVAYTISVSQDG